MPMTRRSWIGLIALASGPGCGMAMRKIQREEMVAMETVPRSFPRPAHRVAVAAFEAMKGELASATFAKDSEFGAGPRIAGPDGSRPAEGHLPLNYPGFWLEWRTKDRTNRELMTLRACHFAGKTRQGRDVTVEVIAQPDVTVVTAHVDTPGDRSSAKALLDLVAERLAHPAHPPGSAEEAAMFKAFFGGVESRESLPNLQNNSNVKS